MFGRTGQKYGAVKPLEKRFMSSSIGLSAVISGCFGTACAAARQQIGLLLMVIPLCIHAKRPSRR
ncbi:Unknown protein sequence [Pseudomonas syringae pv. maculicola]|nr:Unknown protein sequence [Pseudomonas syringae pv. maculicola]